MQTTLLCSGNIYTNTVKKTFCNHVASGGRSCRFALHNMRKISCWFSVLVQLQDQVTVGFWVNFNISTGLCHFPLGEHHPRVQPEWALPEIQEVQQGQRRQGHPVTVPSSPGGGGGGARAAGSWQPGAGGRNQEGQIRWCVSLSLDSWMELVALLPSPLQSVQFVLCSTISH